MARIGTFTLRVNQDERRMLAALAKQLERSQSDAVRLLIRSATRELVCEGKASQHAPTSTPVQSNAR